MEYLLFETCKSPAILVSSLLVCVTNCEHIPCFEMHTSCSQFDYIWGVQQKLSFDSCLSTLSNVRTWHKDPNIQGIKLGSYMIWPKVQQKLTRCKSWTYLYLDIPLANEINANVKSFVTVRT